VEWAGGVLGQGDGLRSLGEMVGRWRAIPIHHPREVLGRGPLTCREPVGLGFCSFRRVFFGFSWVSISFGFSTIFRFFLFSVFLFFNKL
jgi:hypothetical protein